MDKQFIEMIIKKAEEQAKELDYPLAVAFGDIIGGIVYEVDAYLLDTKESRMLTTKEFQERFVEQTIGFCDNANMFEIFPKEQ